MHIAVIIPHFHCLKFLIPNLHLLRRLHSATHQITINVLTTECEEAARLATVRAVGGMATVHHAPQCGKIGGMCLPTVLRAGTPVSYTHLTLPTNREV